MIDPNICKNCPYKWSIDLESCTFCCVNSYVDFSGEHKIINLFTNIPKCYLTNFINAGINNTYHYADKKTFKIFHPEKITDDLIESCKNISFANRVSKSNCPYYMEHKLYEWNNL